MIEQILSLSGAMYAALGPGLMLAAALPVMVVALGVVSGVAYKRFGRRSRA